MNKSELIETLAEDTHLTKKDCERALKAYITITTATLKKGNQVKLMDFGTFQVSHRAAKTGRNPKTGAPLHLKAYKAPIFKPGKAFKQAVN